MSHILDALRRAEDERRLGRAPDRGMIAGPLRRAAQRRRGIGWLASAVALLLAVAVAWLGYERFTAEPPTRAEAPEQAATPPIRTEPLPPSSTPPPDARAAQAAEAAETTESLPTAELPRAELARAERIRDMDALFAEAPAPAAPRPGAAPEADNATRLQPRDALAPLPEAASSNTRPAADDENEALPTAEAAGAPPFTVQVHVWGPVAEERFIRVEGQRLREGDRLPNGARIARITRGGLELIWEGQRVRRPLSR